jgi:tryptophanyl-tRNA synthetase
VDKNVENGEDPDAGITMGLYSYPVLMAADILMFNAHKVPVGRDQIQHVEMARDIGQRFNHLFGNGKEFFTMPEALIEEASPPCRAWTAARCPRATTTPSRCSPAPRR